MHEKGTDWDCCHASVVHTVELKIESADKWKACSIPEVFVLMACVPGRVTYTLVRIYSLS